MVGQETELLAVGGDVTVFGALNVVAQFVQADVNDGLGLTSGREAPEEVGIEVDG
jgi:hypothetical protein